MTTKEAISQKILILKRRREIGEEAKSDVSLSRPCFPVWFAQSSRICLCLMTRFSKSEYCARFCIDESEIVQLAKWACIIEDHYSEKRGKYTPMDIEVFL